MATVRKTAVKKIPTPVVNTDFSFDDEKKPTKSFLEKAMPWMVVLIVIMAFALGSLWTKVSMLEQGNGTPAKDGSQPTAGTTGAPGAKFATIDDAFKAYAQQAGLDGNKLTACVDSGTKKSVIDADTKEGTDLGVNGTPGFFINGKFLGGAFPLSSFKEIIDRELNGTGSTNYKDYKDADLQSAGAQGAFIATPKQINTDNAAVRGPANAKVTIVEFSDFQCPYCQRGFQTMQQVFQAYGDKVKLVYMDFPLVQLHPHAEKAAEAFECARDQDQTKAWAFSDLLFNNQSDWSVI
jgi:protein-disulfide isomerase